MKQVMVKSAAKLAFNLASASNKKIPPQEAKHHGNNRKGDDVYPIYEKAPVTSC